MNRKCQIFVNLQMVVKLKNNDKSKKYILRGQKNARYYEKILSNKKKSYYFVNFL